MSAVVCATLAAVLASAAPGSTISVAKGSDCAGVRIARDMPKQTTLNLGGSTLRGLVITGAGWRLRSGTYRATGGAMALGPNGYAIKIAGRRIRIDGALVTDAKKGIVIDQAAGVTIADSRFLLLGEDGIIASRVAGLTVVRNRFADVIGKPTECRVGGSVTLNVPQRACAGTWTDGFHADGVQMRNGVTDALIENNELSGAMQGIGQFDTAGDAPLERITARANRIAVTTPHTITLGECRECRIEWNKVTRGAGSIYKAVIRPGLARRCGNDVQDERPDGSC
ncbi:hypothetical protein LWE61_14910 [Sphingobium sufflavum]|uniref:hypothetical protein n=1 Tax=Sphingobium sufflavum TaxID=1129547 RepID=UPI001F26A1C7|nr:hypothetical protein [Sphingobium sufflavum]MCE7797840.1 hypothetical protein [Sphingobium sufflavum]